MTHSPSLLRVDGQVIAFRADASLGIGTGHVMRCLTLARALCEAGAECHFLCREHPGHLLEMIQAEGFAVHRLPREGQDNASQFIAKTEAQRGDASSEALPSKSRSDVEHSHWLGVSWQADAKACRPILQDIAPDWLVVDHYALDADWEAAVLSGRARLLVIDDLADRPHIADILLDQNLGRCEEDYVGLVRENCDCLIGPRYALLRPEFAELRGASLARRSGKVQLKRVLISLGGVDKDNATGAVLEALKGCSLPMDCRITVVMGASAPWLATVRDKANELPWQCDVVVNVTDMAERMAQADLAIGAAGSTSWERCCLGVPTLMFELAENQKSIARALHQASAAYSLGNPDALDGLSLDWGKLVNPNALAEMSEAASHLVDGNGLVRLIRRLSELSHPREISNG